MPFLHFFFTLLSAGGRGSFSCLLVEEFSPLVAKEVIMLRLARLRAFQLILRK